MGSMKYYSALDDYLKLELIMTCNFDMFYLINMNIGKEYSVVKISRLKDYVRRLHH